MSPLPSNAHGVASLLKFLFAILILAPQIPAASAASAVIVDAWWTNQRDVDGDGCVAGTGPGEVARLNWDANVTGGAGSLTVFEKIYFKTCGTPNWALFVTTTAHVITGSAASDAQFFDIPMDPSCNCYDYRIEVYRSGLTTADNARDSSNDAELANHREELLAQDAATIMATIADAWWTNQRDLDGDGCRAGLTNDTVQLNWDPNVAGSSGSLTVFERIYYKACASAGWTLYATSTPHVITGASTADQQFALIPMDPNCACYDYLIEIYRGGQTAPDYSRSPVNDLDLAAHREEFVSQDVVILSATIRDAWWTFQQDADGDGCMSGTGAGGKARLNFLPDVTGGQGTLSVFEKVYFRPCASGAWTLYGTSSLHPVTGSNSLEVQVLDITMDPGCACFDYQIEIYRSGMAEPDNVRGPGNDLDLAFHREESVAQDSPFTATATIADAWWTNQRDADSDGCYAGTGAGGTARLNWDPNVSSTNGTLVVFEKIYFKPCASNVWYLFTTNAAHTITNNDPGDHQFVDIPMDPNCSCYDYQIIIFRMGAVVEDDTRDSGNDPDLLHHHEELLATDDPARIRIEPLVFSVNCDIAGPMGSPAFSPAAAPAPSDGGATNGALQRRVSRTKPVRSIVGEHFEPHVITVKFREGSRIRARNQALTNLGPAELEAARNLLSRLDGARWRQSHSLPEERIDQLRQTAQRRLHRELADLNLQLDLVLPAGTDAGSVLDALNGLEFVELAQPIPKPVRPPVPPDLQLFQAYLLAPPNGIDAFGAWTSLGCRGAGIRIADVEYSFRVSHQDLPLVTLVGYPPTDPPGLGSDGSDHGTAVLGQLSARDNGFGITGIAPESSLYFSGTWGAGSWLVGDAILSAAAALRPGDVILIEQQTYGPNYPCAASDQCGLIPVEWFSPWYDAIQTAVGNGIVVVEAAGNGGQDLDDPIYSTGNSGHWPFLPENDSGAILVGAGCAPPFFGGSSVTRSRLDFSNYGSTVDLQGWGEAIWTTGYGTSLGFAGWDEPGFDNDFTGLFGGTSGASPIVAGACALVQSAYKSRTGSVLSPEDIKRILRATGSPQQSGLFPSTENIGPMPDVPSAIRRIVPPPNGDSFRIHNDGIAPLVVSGITTDQPAPWLDWNPKPPFTVPPGTYLTVTFTANCESAPVSSTPRRLLISSSDLDPGQSPYPEGVFVNVHSSVPALHITRSLSSLTISWTASPPGFVLQETADLALPNWTNAPSGSMNPITLSATKAARFYRLRRP